MRITVFVLSVGLLASLSTVHANDWPQWRGPSRDGISKETGLLQQWPATGPALLWEVKDAGNGYAAPSVSGDELYLLGNHGTNNEFIQARELKSGKLLWETRLGNVGNPKQEPSYPGARSTPTVDGDLVYALGSDGDLACLEKKSGKVRWQKSLRSDFVGKAGTWAYSESPLISGSALVCTPGGSQATIVALNKVSGEAIWRCAVVEEEEAAYASAIEVTAGGVRQYVQMLPKGLAGVDAASGKVLWRYPRTVSRFRANIPTPYARGAEIFSAGAGTGAGLVRLKQDSGGVSCAEVYFSPKLPAGIGGIVVLDGHLFGTGSTGLLCADYSTGEIKWEDRATGAASLCYADKRLYLHAESGDVFLVEPSKEGYREKGRFTPANPPKRLNQMEKAWAYPVVANGRLLIRDHNQLWCYDVKAR